MAISAMFGPPAGAVRVTGPHTSLREHAPHNTYSTTNFLAVCMWFWILSCRRRRVGLGAHKGMLRMESHLR